MTEHEARIFVLEAIRSMPAAFRCLPVASEEEVRSEEVVLGSPFSPELRDFMTKVSNGIRFGRIRVLPVKSRLNLKKTADSIKFHNDADRSDWFNGDKKTFSEFMIFGVDESHGCFSFRRLESAGAMVWYWVRGDDDMAELDMGFWQWLAETITQECGIVP